MAASRFSLPPLLVTIAAGFLCASPLSAENPSAGNDSLFQRLDANRDGTIAPKEIPAQHRALFARLIRQGDVDRNGGLSREEFLGALVPSRPEKQLEEKQPGGYPQADAIRYLLLTMDTTSNGTIEASEVPSELRPVFHELVDRIDANDNGLLDRYELSREARQLAQIAGRFVSRQRIDVAAELKRLDKAQGESAKRFEQNPASLIANLQKPGQARKLFKQFDSNSDGTILLDELPAAFQPQLGRLIRVADRDRDGGLSEREFVSATERISRMRQVQDRRQRPRDATDADKSASRDGKDTPVAALQGQATTAESAPEESMAAEDD